MPNDERGYRIWEPIGSRVLGGMTQYSVHGSAAQYGREWRVPVRGRNVNWRVESLSGEQRREPVNPKR